MIPNGVDGRRFHPVDLPRDSARFVVGTVGNLRPVKNHPLLVRACAELARRGVNLELRIAGEGDQREALPALAQSLGFADRLLLAGRTEDVPGFLNRLDVFVLSSDSEQHPNALNEAMACGLACIATRVGCVEELLDGGRCGPIVSPGDVDGLVAALDDLLADETRRRRFASAGRRRVCTCYSLETMVAAYEKMYRRLAGRDG